jgi:hypothetical protein
LFKASDFGGHSEGIPGRKEGCVFLKLFLNQRADFETSQQIDVVL